MVGVAVLRGVVDMPGGSGITLGRKTAEGMQEGCRTGRAGERVDMEGQSRPLGRAETAACPAEQRRICADVTRVMKGRGADSVVTDRGQPKSDSLRAARPGGVFRVILGHRSATSITDMRLVQLHANDGTPSTARFSLLSRTLHRKQVC